MSASAASIYKEVDGLRYYLEQRENSGKDNEFPKIQENFTKVFQQIEDYLNKNIHQEVVTGAALIGDGLLNDHGKEHVAMVIERAGLLLGNKISDLKGFEIFLLLLAIHFHDMGNIYGREEHELHIYDVMEQLGSRLPLDMASQRYITDIAKTHGGMFNGSKDTIASLNETDYLLGVKIRPALIASILRYSDEISDDRTRAARFLHKTKKVPRKNQVFHDYSMCLQPAVVEGNTLILKFDIPHELAIIKSSKLDKNRKCQWCSIFLYDEILNRLKKCLCELEYCRKYSQGFINISSIQADIKVFMPKMLIHEDSIKLRLSGYPEIFIEEIDKRLVAPLQVRNGKAMKKLVEKRLTL